jgi:hypothetical protein
MIVPLNAIMRLALFTYLLFTLHTFIQLEGTVHANLRLTTLTHARRIQRTLYSELTTSMYLLPHCTTIHGPYTIMLKVAHALA